MRTLGGGDFARSPTRWSGPGDDALAGQCRATRARRRTRTSPRADGAVHARRRQLHRGRRPGRRPRLTGWRLDAGGTASLVPRLHDDTAQDDPGQDGRLRRRPRSSTVSCSSPPRRSSSPAGSGTGSACPARSRPTSPSRLLAAYGSGPRRHRASQGPVPGPGLPRPAGRYALVKQPTEYVVGVLRASEHQADADRRQGRRSPAHRPRRPGAVALLPAERRRLAAGHCLADHRRGADPLRLRRSGPWPRATSRRSPNSSSPSQRIDAVAHLLGVDAFSDRRRPPSPTSSPTPGNLVTLALLAPEYLAN